ncbi:DinB family protein [Bacillus oleivorans]|uniref:Putative metal-dependent hydrolase SAMN05877753_102576 n=2 Tax=Bacillus oleivorans TaxID=1448271 RepID=A0A285CLW8_9BACI|nr:DinB family protein [Bacillus oleivorans]
MEQKYPIGKFTFNGDFSQSVLEEWIRDIEKLPHLVREAVQDLSQEQLDTPYRQGGWTIRQVVHHLADSHMNAYIRIKLAITEHNPTIKPYEEAEWAKLPDYELPIDVSLKLLESLHQRWAYLLRNLKPDDLEKTFNHPDSGKNSIHLSIGTYSWHGKHHLAHITNLLQSKGWNR